MPSWYKNTRQAFLADDLHQIVGRLHQAATAEGWCIDPDQDEEWRGSVRDLKATLSNDGCNFINAVLAEYDFRRRGIRIDFVLLAPGALFVLEFKRGTVTAADRDQAANYCVNLVEFHELTQSAKPKVLPVVVSRIGSVRPSGTPATWHRDWPQISEQVTVTTSSELGSSLRHLYTFVPQHGTSIDYRQWDAAPFSPSSTIIDATISLYGQHDVSAIKAHAAPKQAIDRCIASVISEIDAATVASRHELIFVSGAPGAGKTLVGLAITFHQQFRGQAVFVTGNAPLVDVLNGSLQRSYKKVRSGNGRALGGYTRAAVPFVEKNSDFKIVKAHRFLELARGSVDPNKLDLNCSTDGRILVFDEAQRTYTEGTQVNRRRLEKDEATLILEEMQRRPGSIIVLLVGHNQHINTSEVGPTAWLQAAKTCGWQFAASDETLELEDFSRDEQWRESPLRVSINGTHLSHSIRDQRTRNGEIERWAHLVMTNAPAQAALVAQLLPHGSAIRITRSIQAAKDWARRRRTGEERCGLIASGQGRRLRSEGIFVDERPDIVQWMLAPSDDVRSSNMLEQVQNQFQIQGLEIDYSIVCWDADFRRENDAWVCYSVNGSGWVRSSATQEARCNSYRVLLTRSRKGMILFIPKGDSRGEDKTRDPEFYDLIYSYLVECGAKPLEAEQ
jgi:Uncharacterized conserved protein (DUF2075)